MPQSEVDVACLDDVPDGCLHPIEIDGNKLLLIREGAAVHALSATCPHAGGPLAEGVRHGARLVCPWHKAAFCLRTGAALEPPAIDPLARHSARIEAGRVLVATAPDAQTATPETPDQRCFVIVGAGAAGAVAAQTLREIGFGGRVVMLDRDNRVPYDRTLLSKYVLSGEKGGEKSPLQSQDFYRRMRIERRTAEVVAVEPGARRITCADGAVLHYDAALLATGGAPVRPSLPGIGLRGVFLLRSRADADVLLAQVERSERAVVLGASFIGMEVAASLRERGLDVIVAARQPTPFEKQLGVRIGSAFARLHEQRGVAFRLGREVAAIEGDTDASAVRLDDGERLPADVVVIGFGVRPVTQFLREVRLNDDGGIPVDATLRVADGLYAGGDIAAFPLQGDGPSVRVEHWRVAEQHGRVAALNMAGRITRYEAVPMFWTIQYFKDLDYIGHASGSDETIIHGDLDAPEFLAYYVRDGRVAAATGLGRDADTAALTELMRMRRDWTAAELGEHPSRLLALSASRQ
jgi:NADPH-dependent 2,4-dienoyl-CoA reductase/sulfur reductase-like enzyme/nitrite reductase/ring-hydroxylating ferredoxin subunit